jgi:predicted MFS family arabinose efflux permease
MMPAMVQAALNEAGSGRRWAILALLFATRVGLGLQFQTLGSVADPLAKDLHLSFTQIGTLIGLFMIPGLVLAIPLGFAGRYASDRALVAAGLVALALGGGVAAAADTSGCWRWAACCAAWASWSRPSSSPRWSSTGSPAANSPRPWRCWS